MNALLALLQQAVLPEQMTQRLAWVLVHFVWQGAAVAVLLALTLWLGRVRRPTTRYAFGLVALAVMVACPVVTFGLIRPELRADATVTESSMWPREDVTTVSQSHGHVADPLIVPPELPEVMDLIPSDGSQQTMVIAADDDGREGDPLATNLLPALADASVMPVAYDVTPVQASWSWVQPWIVRGWLFGVALLSLRLLLGWLGVCRLRRRIEPVPEWLAERVRYLAKALRVTRPLIHLSHRVTEAVAVGFLRPMILLPVAWVTELQPDMIEAVIAHELAHIRRGDLWVNLLQRLVETLLFYHPAVWWLSRRLRIDRELCCDELVVRTLHNPLRYAETLEHVGRLSLADTLGFAHQRLDARTTLTVSIGSPQNILLNRIRAILTPPQQDRSTSAWLAGLIPLVLACLVGWSLISRNTAPASDEPQQGKPPESATIAAVEPTATSNDIRADNLVEVAGTYRGHIVTDDGSPLPPDLKLMRRVSSEQTRETPVGPNGQFSFGTDPKHGSVRFAMTAAGFAPFDSSWIKLDQPLALTLSRGAMVKLRLVSPAGSGPVTGTAALIVPWWDEDEQGTFPVDANGIVTIARCPKATVKIDVLIPGFEEVRVHRWVRGDVSLDVPLTPAKPTRLRIVSAKDGSPVAGAKVRLFSRTRAGSFLTPFQRWGDGPVWGESNADGRVELTTLRAVDPVPTNDPGAAIYAFQIEAPNHAPCYIGDVRAGSDLGEIQVGDSLEVRGEVVRDAAKPERISLQIRQPTVAQGGGDGRGGWKNIESTEAGGKLTFHLKSLQAGPFDMFIVYSDASEPPNSVRGTIKQLQFHGLLTGSSSNLVVTRESVVPGDKLLTARRTSLFPIDDHPPSNVPNSVSKLLVAGWHTAEEADGKTALQENKPTLQPLFVWSSTSPVQHSMGHVDWRVFVLQDGTVFIPGGMNNEAGTHHKLPAAELQELKSLLEKHRDLFGKQVPKELPQFAGWRNGHETLSYTKPGETKAFVKWYGLEQPPVVGEFDPAGSHEAITEFISRLMTDAACGGRQAKAKYRELANKALTAVLPKATPFNEATWTNTVNGTDGTRTIRFANTDERTEVTLIHPAFGEVYVERIEQFDKRIALDAPLPAPREKADDGVEVRKQTDPKIDNQDAERMAIERAVEFLKSRQGDEGTWDENRAQVEGTTALATVALLQAGVKADEAVIQKALPALRKIEPKMIYVVALQTMALCAASPKDDAELIRRNVAWIENAQVKEGDATGGWSYAAAPAGRADGSCSRFAVLGLDAAKRANFEVRAETWQRIATYWLKSQKENGCWGYVPDSSPTFTMSLAGVAGLATAHRHLPKDEQAAAREAAMRKPHEFIAKSIPSIASSWPFYSFHCLERAGHLTDTVRFGDVDWKSDVTKRLLDAQRGDGAWGQPSATENELIATSFALMFLSGRPEDGKAEGAEKPLDPDQREMRIKPRGGKGATFNVTTHTKNDVAPPLQQSLLEGGIEIEVTEGNGAQLRLQADRAIIMVEANDQTNLFVGRSPVTSLLKLELVGKVTLEFVRQPSAAPIKLQAERLWVDLAKHHVKGEKISLIREGGSATIDWDEFNLPTGPTPKVPLPNEVPRDAESKPEEGDVRWEGRLGQATLIEQKTPVGKELVGRVIDAEGKPVDGAELSVFVSEEPPNETPPKLVQTTKADADGVFRLTVLKHDTRATVWATAAGKGIGVRPVTARGAPPNAEGLPDETVPEESPDRFVIRLNAKAGSVRVIDPANKPVAGAKVTVRLMRTYQSPFDRQKLAEWYEKKTGQPIDAILATWMEPSHFDVPPVEFKSLFEGATDAEGAVTLPGVAADKIRVLLVETENFGRQAVSLDSLYEGKPDGYVFRLSPVGRFEGEVTVDSRVLAAGFKLDGFKLSFKTSMPNVARKQVEKRLEEVDRRSPPNDRDAYPHVEGRADVVLDASGRFSVPMIATGFVELIDPLPQDSAFYVDLLHNVRLEAGKTVSLKVPVHKGVLVRGIIRKRGSHEPVAGRSVNLTSFPETHFRTQRTKYVRTDEAGRFEGHVQPGLLEYWLNGAVDGFTTVYAFEHGHARALSGMHHLVPDNLDGAELPPLELVPVKTRTGRLLDEKGNAADPNWDVFGYPTESRWQSAHGKTTKDGEFTLSFPEPYPPTSFVARQDTWRAKPNTDLRRHALKIVSEDPFIVQMTGKERPSPALRADGSPSTVETSPGMKQTRKERLAAHDREAAKKLVGDWKLTFPRGFIYQTKIEQQPDGLLKLSGAVALSGVYALSHNRLELMDTFNDGARDFVWKLQDDGTLKLIEEDHSAGAEYVGALLARGPQVGQPVNKPPVVRGEEAYFERPDRIGHGVVLSVRGRVMIDGPIPQVPPIKGPFFRGTMPRRNENGETIQPPGTAIAGTEGEFPDDTLVISKEGGIAYVAVYLKKAPKDWTPTPPPGEPVVIEAVKHRFTPHFSFIRAGQPLKLVNSMNEAVNFHSQPLRGTPQNQLVPAQNNLLMKSPYTQSESLPNQFVSDIQHWMKGYLLALDHPFAAITDSDGRFEIRDLPPGEHHFTVWHERRGYLNKDLVIRVENDKVSEVDLKYTAEQLARREDKPASSPNAAAPSTASPVEVDATKQRAARIKANDRDAAAKLVGRWVLTLPADFVYQAEFTQLEDGCLKLSGKKGNNLFGKFAVKGDRLELVEPTDQGIIDFVWQVQSANRLKLIVDENKVGATYLGAKLERIAD